MPENESEERFLPPVAIWEMGRNFVDAATTLQAGQHVAPNYHPVTHYLYGHGIELALKAYLVALGCSERELKACGHDLEKCLTRARESGPEPLTVITAADESVLALLNQSYKAKDLEYEGELPEGMAVMRLPSTGVLENLGNVLLDAVQPRCHASVRGRG